MTDDPLEACKAQVSARYLGKAGIHAVGVSRRNSAVRIFVAGDSPELDQLVPLIRQEVAPFALVVVQSETASASE